MYLLGFRTTAHVFHCLTLRTSHVTSSQPKFPSPLSPIVPPPALPLNARRHVHITSCIWHTRYCLLGARLQYTPSFPPFLHTLCNDASGVARTTGGLTMKAVGASRPCRSATAYALISTALSLLSPSSSTVTPTITPIKTANAILSATWTSVVTD